MYELIMYDDVYCFERRWVFSRSLTLTEMMKVLKYSYGDVRHTNDSLVGNVPLTEYCGKVSSSVYLEFRVFELSDYILEK